MTEPRTIEEILKFLSVGESDGYEKAQDTSRTDMDREWFHGYADACHDLYTFIKRLGPFKPTAITLHFKEETGK